MKKRLDYCLAILTCFSYLVGFGHSSDLDLTTAVRRDSTSAKPTTIHRRINVDFGFLDNTKKALDVFNSNDKDSRRSRSNIWNWDYWCQLQPKAGNCTKNIVRYYYDAQLDLCRTFFHSGCGGNKNQFESMVDCERYCKGASYMPMKYTENISFCSLQPDAGLCMAMIYNYYYDVNEGRCKSFIYGGCGGNQNRFSSEADCAYHCNKNNDDDVI